MSVKLPFIIKRETIPVSSPKQEVKTPLIQPKEQEQLQKEEEEDYQNNDDFQEIEQIKPQQSVQNLTILKSRSQPQQAKLQVDVTIKNDLSVKQQEESKQKIEQLEQLLEEKMKIAYELRQVITNKKQEIKSIGDQLDKDLNKSLLKAAKPNSVNIRDIFSATPKTNSQKVNNLNEELKKIRVSIKKIKGDIKKMQDGMVDPVVLMNEERGISIKTKIRSAQEEVKTIEHEKILLKQEIQRGGKDLNEEQEKQRAEDFQKLMQQLSEVQNSQKQERMKLYQIEKEDIVMMEKIKYFQQREGQSVPKKQKGSQKNKQKIEQEIKQLIIQINGIVEERNKAEIQKKLQSKQLAVLAASLENKNLELYNKLREVDAFLLQYYQKKTRRKEAKRLQKTVDVMESSPSGKVEVQSVGSQQFNKSKVQENDKNIKVEMLIQKKKIYEFGMKEECEGEISLSDEMLGPKINIKSLSIKCYQSKIVDFAVRYRNNFGNQFSGLVMGSKSHHQQTEHLQLVLQKDEVVNFVHTGYSEDHCISFLHLITSGGNQLKWGSLENLIKSEQKHIKKYQTSFFKSKMLIDQSLEQENSLKMCLTGLAIVTTYFAPK